MMLPDQYIIRLFIYLSVHKVLDTSTHTHIYIHIHTHTHTYIYIYIYIIGKSVSAALYKAIIETEMPSLDKSSITGSSSSSTKKKSKKKSGISNSSIHDIDDEMATSSVLLENGALLVTFAGDKRECALIVKSVPYTSNSAFSVTLNKDSTKVILKVKVLPLMTNADTICNNSKAIPVNKRSTAKDMLQSHIDHNIKNARLADLFEQWVFDLPWTAVGVDPAYDVVNAGDEGAALTIVVYKNEQFMLRSNVFKKVTATTIYSSDVDEMSQTSSPRDLRSVAKSSKRKSSSPEASTSAVKKRRDSPDPKTLPQVEKKKKSHNKPIVTPEDSPTSASPTTRSSTRRTRSTNSTPEGRTTRNNNKAA